MTKTLTKKKHNSIHDALNVMDSSDEESMVSSSEESDKEQATVFNNIEEYNDTYERIHESIFKYKGKDSRDHKLFKIDTNKAKAQYMRNSKNKNLNEDIMIIIWMHAICYRHAKFNKMDNAPWERKKQLKSTYEKGYLPRYSLQLKKKKKFIESSDDDEEEFDSENEGNESSDDFIVHQSSQRTSEDIITDDFEEKLGIDSKLRNEKRKRKETHGDTNKLNESMSKQVKTKEQDALRRDNGKFNLDNVDFNSDDDDETNIDKSIESPTTRIVTVHLILHEMGIDRLQDLARRVETYVSTAYSYVQQQQPTLFPHNAMLSRTHKWGFNTYEYEEVIGTGDNDKTPIEDLIRECVSKALLSMAKKTQSNNSTNLLNGNTIEHDETNTLPTGNFNVGGVNIQEKVVVKPVDNNTSSYKTENSTAGVYVNGFNLPSNVPNQSNMTLVNEEIEDRIYWGGVLNDMNLKSVIAQSLNARRGGGNVSEQEVELKFKDIQMECGRGMKYNPDRKRDSRGWKVYTSIDLQEMQNVASTLMANEGFVV